MEDNGRKRMQKANYLSKSQGIGFINISSLSKFTKKNEFFALVAQIKRAVVSVLLNIVEEYSKSSRKEYCRFADISIGSTNELGILFE